MQYTPTTKRELMELQVTIFVCAPDDFLPLPNLTPREQRTLESTVEEIHRGIDYVFRKERNESSRANMHAAVDKMYSEFKNGRTEEGRATSLDFADMIKLTKP